MKRAMSGPGWSGLAALVATALAGCAPAQPGPGVPPHRAGASAASALADAGVADALDARPVATSSDAGPDAPMLLCEAIGCADLALISVVLPMSAAEVARCKSRVCIGSGCVDTDPPSPPGTEAGHFPGGEKTIIPLSSSRAMLRFRLHVSPELAVDGTVFSVQVDSPTRGRVLKVSRALRTTSQGFHPAGPLCGTPCRLVVARWYPNSKSGITCDSDPCESGLVVHLDVRDVITKLGGASVVQMCRNAVCVDTSLPRLNEIAGGTWSTAPVKGLLVGSLVEFHPPGDLTIKVLSDPITLRDGDRYVVGLYAAPNELLWSYETVAKYQSSYPNGVECDTVPCKTMVVHSKP